MFPDFEELLSCLNAEGAKYLVVGGYAVGQHAQPRATKDLDIFIGPNPDNAAAVWRAIARFGAPFISLDDLIANKLAAGRLQDLADVEALRQAGALDVKADK